MGTDSFCFIGLGDTGMRLLQALPVDFLRHTRLYIDTDSATLAAQPNANTLLIGQKFLEGGASPSIAQTIKAINMAEKELLAELEGITQVVILADLGGETGGAAPYLAELLLKRRFNVSLALIAPFELDKERDHSWQRRVNALRPTLTYCEVFDSPFQDNKKGRQTLIHRLLKDVSLRVLNVLMADNPH